MDGGRKRKKRKNNPGWPNRQKINLCHWPDRLWTNEGLAALSISSLMQKPLSNPPTHLDPNPIIQMQHVPRLLLSPMLQPVSSAVPHTDIPIHILSCLVIHPEAQGGEVGHLDAGLVVEPLNLVVQPPHVFHVVMKVPWTGATVRKPT